MSTLTLGGLATGMDTNAIVQALVDVKRVSITRLEERKTAQTDRLTALKLFDTKLDAFLMKVDKLDTGRELIANKSSQSSEDYLTSTAYSSAVPGSYEIKVGQLAQVEKSVFAGVASKDTAIFGTGTLSLTHDNLDPALYPSGSVDITIDDTNNTLEGIRDAINAESSNSGITASIVNDGSGTPYRLVLTGKTVEDSNISLTPTGLTGFPAPDPTVSRSAQQAIVQVDGITITSNTNTLTEAIPGVTLELSQADPAFDPASPNWDAVASTNLKVSTDSAGIQQGIEEMVTAFNDLVEASKSEDLGNDRSLYAVVSTLRGKLYNSADGTGLYQLGVKTEKDGTLTVDSSKLAAAIGDNLDMVQSLMAGDDSLVSGIADELKAALSNFTSPTTGILANRQSLIETSMYNLDQEIGRAEDRLSAYEEALYAKFSAMETLVSSLNSQMDYFAQQTANNK